ncbi:unnamed protein product [Leptosia nina]|uniref:Uncharacterized protein n=1 Tax=Leptosia nina TaxID=320188 RepID=A0AAV1K5Y3_9NEOP
MKAIRFPRLRLTARSNQNIIVKNNSGLERRLRDFVRVRARFAATCSQVGVEPRTVRIEVPLATLCGETALRAAAELQKR